MAEKEKGIRKAYDPTDKEREILTTIYRNRYPAMRDNEKRLQMQKIWDKADQAWENYRREKDANGEEWQSNHVVPIVFSAIETGKSEIIDNIPKPFILPRGEEDVPRARIMSNIYDTVWDTADSDLAVFDGAHDALLLGTTIWQEYYWKDRRMIQNVVGFDEKKKEKIEETEIFDYDDVYGEIVKLQEFFVDDMARSFRGPYRARDCIRRYIMHIDDFKAYYQGPVWDPLGNAKYVKPGGDTNYYEFYAPPDGIDKEKQVEVLWYWAEKPKDALWIVANDVVIRPGPNPYRHKRLPFARAVDIRRPHSFWGKGEYEILESTQDESNVLRRMIIDRNHLDIDKMFIVSNRLGLNDEDLIARPHGMIPADDTESAKPVEYGDIPRSVELSLKHLEDDATISTGINPRAQSLPTAGSATEAAILKESTLKRIRMKLWIMRHELLKDVARLRVANILQFYSQPKMEKIVGDAATMEYKNEVARLESLGMLKTVGDELYQEKYPQIRLEGKELAFDVTAKNVTERTIPGVSFFQLRPDYFVPVSRGGYDIKFSSGTQLELSKPLMQSKMLELYDRLIMNPAYDPGKLGDEVIRAYEKDPNKFKPDEVIISEQEQRLGLMIDLAGIENQQMVKGVAVPATPNVSPAHTRMHVEFMQSEAFQSADIPPEVGQMFSDHIMGELAAQEMRGMAGGGAMGGQPQANAANGITNRPGGMKQPVTKTEEVLPGFNTGGNKRAVS